MNMGLLFLDSLRRGTAISSVTSLRNKTRCIGCWRIGIGFLKWDGRNSYSGIHPLVTKFCVAKYPASHDVHQPRVRHGEHCTVLVGERVDTKHHRSEEVASDCTIMESWISMPKDIKMMCMPLTDNIFDYPSTSLWRMQVNNRHTSPF